MGTRRIVAAALVLWLCLWTGGAAVAGPLSGGNTLYVVEGEEARFTFDPIVRRDGTLLADEVFQALGVTVTLKGSQVEVGRAPVKATLTLGTTLATVDGQRRTLAPAPIHIGDHVFLPLDLLREFGVDIQADGALVTIHDMTRGLVMPTGLDGPAFQAAWAHNTLHTQIKPDDGKPVLDAEVTRLTPELVASDGFAATYRQRVEYLSALQTGTLLLVQVTNRTGRAVTLRPGSLSLVDEAAGEQYDVVQALAYHGMIDQRIASGAVRASVLVFPTLPESLTSVSLFSDSTGALGTLPLK